MLLAIVTGIAASPLRASIDRGTAVKALYFHWRSGVAGGKNQDSWRLADVRLSQQRLVLRVLCLLASHDVWRYTEPGPFREGSSSATLDIHWSITAIISYSCCARTNEGKKSAATKLYWIWKNCFWLLFTRSGVQIEPKGVNRGVKPYVAHCLFKKTSISFAKYQSREKDLCVFHFSLLTFWCD